MSYPFNALGLSHKFISEHVKKGDFCIDGTAGKGRDTLFLSRLVGEEGKVIALDIQPQAVEFTKTLLCENNITWAEVYLSCHSKLSSFAEKESVDAIMFNFGWLPGGDHNIFSRADSSIPALKSALELLKPGGKMSLCLYYGKENGTDEKDRILTFVKELDQKEFSVLLTDFINRKGEPPIAVLITKEPGVLS